MAGCRRPKTQQERRVNESNPWARPCRRPGNLPTWYDDIWSKSQKSWKKHRKTQYRMVFYDTDVATLYRIFAR